MSLPRLVFLYPHLFKSAKAYECSLPHHPPRTGGKRSRKSTFSTSTQQRQESYAQRYGSAAEPQPPPLAATNGLGGKSTLANTIEKEVKAPALKPEERKPDTTEIKQASSAKQEAKNPPEKDYQPQPSNDFLRGGKLDSSKALAREPLDVAASNATGNSLETVLHTENPADKQSEEHKPPHLHAPPYVHHFDTFTLVRDLQKGGFTEGQSVNLMKAVRSLLAINLEVAREGLVSKSEMENETYLFRAACSELRTEILNTRKASTSKMATQRAHLQHEVDILSQKASQDSLALKDDLRGMLNDRKMAVRMQHQARDSKIQELNYKITVALNSDSKSEVEGLRWVLTRRAAMAIASMAILILGSLRYSSYKIHEREQERHLAVSNPASASVQSTSSNSGSGSGAMHTVHSRDMGTQTSATDAVLRSTEDENGGGIVSLG